VSQQAGSGVVVVDKPPGMTSHDVVAQVRRLAGTRKVGHAGTLDPMATGVLVVGVNRATRLLGHLLLTDKAYAATIRLGVSTTTDDAEGEVLSKDVATWLQPGLVNAEFEEEVGEILQVPSAVSAIKVDGKRAHQRVRDGEHVELPARTVTIHSLEVLDQRAVGEFVDVDIAVSCSSGTYVRAIARDVGRRLHVGGHLTALRRTTVGPFTLDDARTLEQLSEEWSLLQIAEVARRCFPSYELDERQAADVRFGRKLALDLGHLGAVALFAPGGEFLALYEQEGEIARAVAVFTG
jgi:tRNA pseudouridine55 synthase